jgi:acetyltransferase
MYGDGLDLIVGTRQDNQFGPLVVVGSGGTEVELLRDIMTGIAPLTAERAGWMLDQTRAGIRLRGWRGNPPGDRDAVIDSMMRIGQLACDFPEIRELEMNPLRVFRQGDGAVALDIRGSLSENIAKELLHFTP